MRVGGFLLTARMASQAIPASQLLGAEFLLLRFFQYTHFTDEYKRKMAHSLGLGMEDGRKIAG